MVGVIILIKKKKVLILAVVLMVVMLVVVVSGNEVAPNVFSPSRLAGYTGLQGTPAYIAVSGKVYDVTESPFFQDGLHFGYQAGQELTKETEASPHGLAIMSRLEPIGVYVELELTKEELAVFDGRSGQPGYIAVNGLIYDVSHSARWRNGLHNSYRAGQDLTVAIERSPHGTATLSRMPLVGVLVQE